MKSRRLSLGRKPCNKAQGTRDAPVDISDDDSFDLSPNIQKNTRECTNVTSHGAASVPSMIDASKSNSKHDMSDDLSSDEDVVILDKMSNTFNKSPSMFNWNKNDKSWNGIRMNFATDTPCQDNFPESSVPHSSKKVVSIQTPNKKQKLMNDQTSFNPSHSDDESISNLDIQKDDSLPQVGIQHEIMIAGIKVKLPVKPYPCQIAVMNSVSTMIV